MRDKSNRCTDDRKRLNRLDFKGSHWTSKVGFFCSLPTCCFGAIVILLGDVSPGDEMYERAFAIGLFGSCYSCVGFPAACVFTTVGLRIRETLFARLALLLSIAPIFLYAYAIILAAALR